MSAATPADPASNDGAAPAGAGLRLPALLGLIVALLAAAVLSADQLELLGRQLPGCGGESDCEELTKGPWGRLPGLGWPLSFLGLAWFCGLLTSWPRRAPPSGVLAALIVLGGLDSLLLLGVMVVEGAFCPWCATAHAGHLLFVVLALVAVVRQGQARAPAGPALLRVLVLFALVLAGLLVAQSLRGEVLEQESHERLAENTRAVVAGEGREVLTRRWVRGPADARIRVTMFSDFQCPLCGNIEGQLERLLAERDDVNISIRHFPLNLACQPDLPKDFHDNACRAARLAESAGVEGGSEGFFAVADWLYEREAQWDDDAVLAPMLEAAGLDAARVLELSESPQAWEAVQADIDEAKQLGIALVPLIFLNGVELKDHSGKNKVYDAVQALAAALDAGADASEQAPPRAAEKVIDDWVAQEVREVPPDAEGWPRGDGPIEVLMWGDYPQPQTRELLAAIEAAIGGLDDVTFTYRAFPLDRRCNETYPDMAMGPGSCISALAAQAAGQLGGAEAFWAMHHWLRQAAVVDRETLAEAAPGLGLDPTALLRQLSDPSIPPAIQDDCRGLRAIEGVGVPAVYVNRKLVPRWTLKHQPDVPVMTRILEAARDGR